MKQEVEALRQIRKRAKRLKRAPKVSDEVRRIAELEAEVKSLTEALDRFRRDDITRD